MSEPSQKKQRTLGSMFNIKKSTIPKRRFRGVELPDGWYARETTLVRRDVGCNYTSTKIASFDFDNCLVTDTTYTWKSNQPLPIRPGVVEKLRELHNTNYRLVIFTNEKTISQRVTTKSIYNAIVNKTSRLNEFIRTLMCPMEIFIATDDDQYRKGNGTGMWDVMLEDCTQYHIESMIKNVRPSILESFFVGDAAGREGDHSDGDKLFANSIGIEFYTESAYFPLPLSNTSTSSIDDLKRLGGTQMLVILVGKPGSGKTLFTKNLQNDDEWEIISQDELGSRSQCEHITRRTLHSGKRNVIIDRTNIDINQRSHWCNIGFQQKLCNIIVIEFGLDMNDNQLASNILQRKNHKTLGNNDKNKIRSILRMMSNHYIRPSLSEGIDLILNAPANLEERNNIVHGLRKWAESRRSGGYSNSSNSTTTTQPRSDNSSNNSASLSSSSNPSGETKDTTSSKKSSTTWNNNNSEIPGIIPPTFLFTPIAAKDDSFTIEQHVDALLSCSIQFLNEFHEFYIELALDTSNNIIHQKIYQLIKLKLIPDRFRLLVNMKPLAYPLLESSRASIVSTPSVFKFGAGKDSLNTSVHNNYNKCRKGRNVSLQQLTLKRHKMCKTNHSYVVDIPSDVLFSNDNSMTKVTQIVHTMNTNNPMEAYTNMFGTMKRNYINPIVNTNMNSMTDEFGFDIGPPTTFTTTTTTASTATIKNHEKLIANVGVYSLQAIPMTYNPPKSKPAHGGHWSNVLNDYLKPSINSRQKEQIFMETSKFIVIYDGFPKSTIHLLLIPRPSYFNCIWPKNCTKVHLPKIQVLHHAVREIKDHIEKHFFNDNIVPKGTAINVGYHRQPSLQRMHIHLISNDFNSPNMKTKKHRDSFMTDFFVGIDTFEQMLKERD